MIKILIHIQSTPTGPEHIKLFWRRPFPGLAKGVIPPTKGPAALWAEDYSEPNNR